MTLPPRHPGRRLAQSIVNVMGMIVLALTFLFAPLYLASHPDLLYNFNLIYDSLMLMMKIVAVVIISIILLVIGIGISMWLVEEHHEYDWMTTGRVFFTEESDVGENRRCHNCRQIAEVDEGAVTGKEIISGLDTVVMGFLINREEQTKRFDCMECYEADAVTYGLREENPGYRPEEEDEAEEDASE